MVYESSSARFKAHIEADPDVFPPASSLVTVSEVVRDAFVFRGCPARFYGLSVGRVDFTLQCRWSVPVNRPGMTWTYAPVMVNGTDHPDVVSVYAAIGLSNVLEKLRGHLPNGDVRRLSDAALVTWWRGFVIHPFVETVLHLHAGTAWDDMSGRHVVPKPRDYESIVTDLVKVNHAVRIDSVTSHRFGLLVRRLVSASERKPSPDL